MMTGLYYPHIDINDGNWLRSSILFWDELRTIVPEKIEDPYKEADTQICQQEGFLKPINLALHDDVVEKVGSFFKKKAEETAWNFFDAEILPDINTRNLEDKEVNKHLKDRFIHVQKIPSKLRPEFRNIAEIYREKLSNKMRKELAGTSERRKNPDWIEMDPSWIDFYMSILSSELAAKTKGLHATTNYEIYHDTCFAKQMEEQSKLSEVSAEGALLNVVIENTKIDPEVPIQTLLNWRRDRKHQLAALYNEIDLLAESLTKADSVSEFRELAREHYAKKIAPEISGVRNSLRYSGIGWLGGGIITAATLTAPTAGILETIGVPVKAGLSATAFLTFAGLGLKLWADQKRAISNHRFAYLIETERKFRPAKKWS